MTTTLICPVCHTNNTWHNNAYKQGIFFFCATCSVRSQQVFCPHCSSSNTWLNPKVSVEGQLINCSSCYKSFQFICCPHCERINMWRGANYKQGLICNCGTCSRPFQQINCVYCFESNAYPTAASIQGNQLTCRSCTKAHQYIRCPHCQVGQVWKNCDYTEGSIVPCWSCRQNFAHMHCPHCKKSQLWKNPLATTLAFVCSECKRDMCSAVNHPSSPTRERSSIKRDKTPSSTSLHHIERSLNDLSLKQATGRSAAMTRDINDGAVQCNPRDVISHSRPNLTCAYFAECQEFVKYLAWSTSFFDMKHDHCYCETCYADHLPDTLHVAGADYVVPRGWAGFGLGVDPFRGDNIWTTWIVVYHGTTAIAAQSILTHRQFLLPGDHLIGGAELPIREGHIEEQLYIYTSPSIHYSSLDCYSTPDPFKSPKTGKCYEAQIVLQCKQMPGTFDTQEETVGWGTKPICNFVPNDRIEHFTNQRSTIIPYRLLIRLEDA